MMPRYYYHFFNIAIVLLLSGQQHVHARCVNSFDYSRSRPAAHLTAAEQHVQLEQDLESYYSLIEESLHHRVKSIELFEQLTQELQKNDYLSSAGLMAFKQGIKAHVQLRERLYQVAKARECWLQSSYDDLEPGLRMTGIMLSLSAALTLYDNYLLVIAMFQESDQLRRIIDQPDQGFGLSSNHLLDASLAFHSVINREKMKYAIKFYQRHSQPARESSINYLSLLIEQSPSYQIMKSNSALTFLQDKIKFYTIVTNDSLKKLEREGINLLSLIFGNTIGMVESRKGKLYRYQQVQKDLLKLLKPGDILLEKTPFRLTDQFIPGYWGHAAIWIGDEVELRRLGLWQHPLIQPWHESIRSGDSIVQALRSGVELDPLAEFMNIDDLVVLRDPGISEKQLRTVIINAVRQLGKAYDFNFDISSSDRIVCSELIYISYLHIDWPTEKTLGRYTISPDHIAVKAQAQQLKVVKLYLDGQPIDGNLDDHLLSTLMQ